MKKLILAVAVMVGSLSFAQSGEREKMSPEQRVDNQLKEMTASLNLTDKQRGEVKVLLLEQSKKNEAQRAEMKMARKKGEKPSDEQIAAMKKNKIDEQLAMKTKMKKILTEEQLKKMKEIRHEKGKERFEKRKSERKGTKKPE